MFETPNAYVCERSVGEDRSCDFRSGRTILQRTIEPAQMTKLLETGKTDLLQFVSARTRRPFSAYLVKQPDGKVGFEFEAKEPGRRGARPMRSAPLRVLGTHPRDRQPIELHAGRYGPYVKHGATNATLPDRDAVDSLSLEQAVALVDEKAGREPRTASRTGAKTRAPRKVRKVAEAETAKPARRVVGARGARAESAAAPAVARTPTRTAPAGKRAPASKKSSASRTAGAPAANAKTPASRATVVKKRAAVKRIAQDAKSADGASVERKGTSTSRTSRVNAPAARKTGTSATARKSKRR